MPFWPVESYFCDIDSFLRKSEKFISKWAKESEKFEVVGCRRVAPKIYNPNSLSSMPYFSTLIAVLLPLFASLIDYGISQLAMKIILRSFIPLYALC